MAFRPGRSGADGVRVHLVSPVFHGYWSAIACALQARGHEVTSFTYDHNPSLGHRGWHQARHELPHRLGVGQRRGLAKAHTAGAARSVAEARPEVVVVIKGDTLGDAFWSVLDERRLPRITWLYDEVRRTRWDIERLAQIGPVATYSAVDDVTFRSSRIDSRWLPLAFDHRLVQPQPTTRSGEIVFVGARYPDRERALTLLTASGVPVRAYGRDWSGRLVDRARTWRWHRPPVPGGRDLERADAYRQMAAAAATLNIHGDQDGFTMRTFEAAGVGGVQLVDRPDIGSVYEPGKEVLTWATDDELVELCNRALSEPARTDTVREEGRRRTLSEHTFDHRVAILEAAWDTA